LIPLRAARTCRAAYRSSGWPVRALDNILNERLWRTVKYEEVYLHDLLIPEKPGNILARHFDFYNRRRIHQALDYLTPAQVFFESSP
jgi:putative transposase